MLYLPLEFPVRGRSSLLTKGFLLIIFLSYSKSYNNYQNFKDIIITKMPIPKIIDKNPQDLTNKQIPQTKIPSLIITTIIIIRLIFIILPLNYDYPDQYWQGPQIAYKIYNRLINQKQIGFQTWEWTLDDPIRNPLYQFLLCLGYVLAYYVSQGVKCVQQWYGFLGGIQQNHFDMLMEISPKIIQALLAIVGDIYLVKLILFFFPTKNISSFRLFFILSNWFYFSMLSRTYINSFQCIIMTVSFYYWQQHHYMNTKQLQTQNTEIKIYDKNDLMSRALVTIGYVARPTSLIPWIIIWPYELFSIINFNQRKGNLVDFRLILKIVAKNIVQIVLMLCLSFIIGSLYFTKPTLTEWNFVYVFYSFHLILGNLYPDRFSWSQVFGIHPWHFYLTNSFTIILGLYSIFFCIGLSNGIFGQQILYKQKPKESPMKTLPKNSQRTYHFKSLCWMFLMIFIMITLMSGHKQHRFLMILMPFLLIINYGGLIKFISFEKQNHKWNSCSKILKILLIFLVIISNLFVLYSIAFYPKGGINILRHIRNDIDISEEKRLIDKNIKYGVIYLCESHTLPAYSIILRNIMLRIPDQSPMKKLSGENQFQILQKNSKFIFQKFKQQFQDLQSQQYQIQTRYIVLQKKLSPHQDIDRQKKQKKQDFSSYELTESFKFLQDQYELVKVENNRNFWQEIIFGVDQLYLYRKKN